MYIDTELHTHAYTHTPTSCACSSVLLSTSLMQTWSHTSGGGIKHWGGIHSSGVPLNTTIWPTFCLSKFSVASTLKEKHMHRFRCPFEYGYLCVAIRSQSDSNSWSLRWTSVTSPQVTQMMLLDLPLHSIEYLYLSIAFYFLLLSGLLFVCLLVYIVIFKTQSSAANIH